jgi:hypothetical protein
MVKVLSPNFHQKLKAPSITRPSSSSVDARVIDQFVSCQREILSWMTSLERYDLSTTIITSPFAGVVVYSLMDTFRLIVAHERRHFGQAQRVMGVNGFPK